MFIYAERDLKDIRELGRYEPRFECVALDRSGFPIEPTRAVSVTPLLAFNQCKLIAEMVDSSLLN